MTNQEINKFLHELRGKPVEWTSNGLGSPVDYFTNKAEYFSLLQELSRRKSWKQFCEECYYVWSYKHGGVNNNDIGVIDFSFDILIDQEKGCRAIYEFWKERK